MGWVDRDGAAKAVQSEYERAGAAMRKIMREQEMPSLSSRRTRRATVDYLTWSHACGRNDEGIDVFVDWMASRITHFIFRRRESP
jgi:hypothetical protein